MKPVENTQLRFAACKTKADIALWQGRVKDDKLKPSNISVRLREKEEGAGEKTIYLSDRDALLLSAVLQDYALKLFGLDGERRLDNWKKNQETTLKDALE
ncbi:MAG: hypothetical protein V1834_00230 [Candidatus Micrarchaeota archaeon]